MRNELPVLIVTAAMDSHAPVVAWALEQAGVPVLSWDWGYYPAAQSLSNYIDADDGENDRHRIGAMEFTSVRTCWYRRQGKVLPARSTHPDDVDFVRFQASRHVLATLHSLQVERWVNHPSEAKRVESKLPQLRAARAVGFRIPPTLVTNSPEDLAAFRSRFPGPIIAKPFVFHTWRDPQGRESFFQTTRVPKDIVLSREEVELCPNIFQMEVKKDHELRVTVFGEHVFALKIEGQAARDSVDWRIDQAMGMPVSIVELSPDLRSKCLAVCKELGLAYGALDLMVAPSGEVYFAEVNQAGEFLFMDEEQIRRSSANEFGVLQYFCAFLAGNGATPEQFPSIDQYRCSDAYRAWQRETAQRESEHVDVHVTQEQ